MPLRLIFMGTPDFAVPTLIELVGRRPRDRRGLYPRAEARRPRHGVAGYAGGARGEALGLSGADAEDARDTEEAQAEFARVRMRMPRWSWPMA